ncbi:MAG: DUF2797 domain-containing protein [Crocinitomicaceae bacterium]
MKTVLEDVVKYSLKSEEKIIELNDLIGQSIQFEFTGTVQCMACGDYPKKLFAQGFCYSCFTNSPQAAECIIRPELCRAHLGEGRDVEWEKKHHFQPHIVYFAVASALKVGVTRSTQVPTRWIDQGASQAIKIAEVPYRQLAGEIEVALKSSFTDKTNWRKMLKNEVAQFDLEEEKWRLEELLPDDLSQYMTEDDEIHDINYPVLTFPEKIKSVGFDKTPIIEGKLLGIKGQYLLLDNDRVLNIRKHEGYYINLNF